MTNVKVFFLIFFVFGQRIFAYEPQEGNVTAIIGPFVSQTHYQSSASNVPNPVYGNFGLIAQGDINDAGSLEIALFHMQKTYIREDASRIFAEKTELMHITMGYRYWINPKYSVSLALSSSYPMNQPKVIRNDLPIGQEIDTSSRDTVDYGFDFSVQSELWQKERYSVVADVRYGLSVTEKQNENGSHYGILIGLKYLIQEKYPKLTKPQN